MYQGGQQFVFVDLNPNNEINNAPYVKKPNNLGIGKNLVFDRDRLGDIDKLLELLLSHTTDQLPSSSRRLEDTMPMWKAWVPSRIDMLASKHSAKLAIISKKACEDNENIDELQRLLEETQRRTETTRGTWIDFLADFKTRHDLITRQMQEARSKAVAEYKIVCDIVVEKGKEPWMYKCQTVFNIARAQRKLQNDRRTLTGELLQKTTIECEKVMKSISPLFDTLASEFEKDVAQISKHLEETKSWINKMIDSKKNWGETCRMLASQYIEQVHSPLIILLQENNTHLHVQASLVASALDDNTDPFYVRRCSIAIKQLEDILVLFGHTTTIDSKQSLKVLETEKTNYTDTAMRLKKEMKELTESLKKINSITLDTSATRTAILVSKISAAREMLSNKIEDTRKETVALEEQISNLRQSPQFLSDRKSAIESLKIIAEQVYSTCLQMRERFDASKRADRLSAQLLQNYVFEAVHLLHNKAQHLCHAVVAAARSKYLAFDNEMDKKKAKIVDYNSKINALHRERLWQESDVINHEEMSFYAALERYVGYECVFSQIADTEIQIRGSIAMCEVAVRLLD